LAETTNGQKSSSHHAGDHFLSLPTQFNAAIMSGAAVNKITLNSPSRASPSEVEVNLATALHDLETNIPDMRSALRPLQFVTAREVRWASAINHASWLVAIPLAIAVSWSSRRPVV
jgi:hypothetical protein